MTSSRTRTKRRCDGSTNPWGFDMCECKVGPGKFEGESALTFLAYQSSLLGGADATTYDGGDMPTDWFRRPFNFDADAETVDAARAYGYCEPCIVEALTDASYGLAIRESDQGFVYSRTFDTRKEFDAALDEAETFDADSPSAGCKVCHGNDDDAI